MTGTLSNDPIGVPRRIGEARTPRPGRLLTYLVERPEDVRTVMGGATEILKPVRKALFGSYSGVHRSPDGALWTVPAEQKEGTGEPQAEPRPSEMGALLGVADVVAAARFYTALGFTADRRYGSKYADFTRCGIHRLGLMPRGVLAKDAGVTGDGSGSEGLTLEVSSADPEGLLQRAGSAGARAVDDAGFTDPEGFRWQVVAA